MSAPSPTPEPSAAAPRAGPQAPPLTPGPPPVPAAPAPPAPAAARPQVEPAGLAPPAEAASERPRLQQPVRGRRYARPADPPASPLTPEQRLLVLDAWRRSGLPAGDFAPLVGISKHTLYAWKRKFDADGPAGLLDAPRGPPAGSRLPEVTRRAILMLKQDNPDWGCERIAALLLRGPALPKTRGSVNPSFSPFPAGLDHVMISGFDPKTNRASSHGPGWNVSYDDR